MVWKIAEGEGKQQDRWDRCHRKPGKGKRE
jgi:hypothetical protein